MEQSLIQVIAGYIKTLEQKDKDSGLSEKEQGMLFAYQSVLKLPAELHNEE